MEAATTFSGPTVAGGMFQSMEVDGAVTYFTGYLAHKLNNYHIKYKGTSVSSCEACAHIFAKKDLTLHLFTSFKEYVELKDESLTYCSREFIDLIVKYERIFLYCFENHRHVSGFCKLVDNFLNCCSVELNFCCVQVSKFLRQYFAVCRTLQCIRHMNKIASSQTVAEKIKKITHL
jgi:hypothetical protein